MTNVTGEARTDERRGIHLLSPGDVVRFQGLVMNVTAVYIAPNRRYSTVGLTLPEATEPLIVPLIIIEEACEVYLRAQRTSP